MLSILQLQLISISIKWTFLDHQNQLRIIVVKMSDEAYDASLDLLRRLNPAQIESNLQRVCQLQPELASDLLSSVDTPIGTKRDSQQGQDFLVCDYNRDGDSYRSPYTNKYYPTEEEGAPLPSAILREVEVWANKAFDIYRDLYYEGGMSNVYLWDQEDGDCTKDGQHAFDGVVLIKKKSEDDSCWDSIHVFEITVQGEQAEYKCTSTIILKLANEVAGLNGSLMKQTQKTLPFKDVMTHVENIGGLVEEVETQMRNMLQEVYFGKTSDVVSDIRAMTGLKEREQERERREMVSQK